MTEIKTSSPGRVSVSNEVIAMIAGTAAIETEGVAGLAGHFTNDISEVIARKHIAKGIGISVDGETVAITANITVKFGRKVQEVSLEVQKKIKTAIETMTGLAVAEVNVNVGAVAGEKQRGV